MKVVKEKRRKSLLRARAEGSKREDFSFLYTSPSALPSTLFCHLTKRPKRSCPQRENYVGDFSKNVGLFSKKLPRFFVFLLRFSNSLGEKNDAPRFLMAKSKDDNRTPKITAQNIQSARIYTFFRDYLKFYLCMPIKIYNFAK